MTLSQKQFVSLSLSLSLYLIPSFLYERISYLQKQNSKSFWVAKKCMLLMHQPEEEEVVVG